MANAFGDVIDEHGQILAGVRGKDEVSFAGALNILPHIATQSIRDVPPTNTVVGVVATNAQLSKEDVNKVAQMAHNGIAQAIRPAHTMFDGDTIFALASGTVGPANVSVIGAFAAEMVALAIRRAVRAAHGLGGLPSIHELKG